MCKCNGIIKLVAGFLLLVNAFVWPQWLGIDGWIKFIAVLMVIGGFLKLVIPACKCKEGSCCSTEKPMPVKKGKK